MKVKIEIDTRTFVRFWLVVIGFGLAGLMIYSAREALMVLGAALFLALALNGPVSRLVHILPNKSRLGGTALAFILVIALLGSIIWFVVPPMIQQSAKFIETIPAIADEAGSQWVGLRRLIDDNGLRPQVDAAMKSIQEQSASWAAGAGSNILGGVGSLASFLMSLFLTVVLSFLMLLEGPAWMNRLWSVYRDKQQMKYHKNLVDKVHGVVTGYIMGQLTVSAIGAVASGLAVFILSLIFVEIPANLAMPTILTTFILSLIPMFGATIAGLLVGLLLLFNDPVAAVIYVIYFVIYQQIENNFIAPSIQAKKVELSALIVLVSVTIGIYVGGVVGGVVAIPIAGSIKVFIEEYLSRRPAIAQEKPTLASQIKSKITKNKTA